MEAVLASLIERCRHALEADEPHAAVEAVVREAVHDPVIVYAVSRRTRFAQLQDLAIYRSDTLTLLAGALPGGFTVAPHNHNLWSVVGVCAGQEENLYFERSGDGLRQIGEASVHAPDVLSNGPEVIHAIHNPLDAPLVAVHAYGGDLFATPRSNWDPVTYKEVPFDWANVRSE